MGPGGFLKNLRDSLAYFLKNFPQGLAWRVPLEPYFLKNLRDSLADFLKNFPQGPAWKASENAEKLKKRHKNHTKIDLKIIKNQALEGSGGP